MGRSGSALLRGAKQGTERERHSGRRNRADDAFMKPHELHDRMLAEHDRLDRTGAGRRDWTMLSVAILDSVTQCQSIIIELQRQMIELADGASKTARYLELRETSRDALDEAQHLMALYQAVQTRLAAGSE